MPIFQIGKVLCTINYWGPRDIPLYRLPRQLPKRGQHIKESMAYVWCRILLSSFQTIPWFDPTATQIVPFSPNSLLENSGILTAATTFIYSRLMLLIVSPLDTKESFMRISILVVEFSHSGNFSFLQFPSMGRGDVVIDEIEFHQLDQLGS